MEDENPGGTFLVPLPSRSVQEITGLLAPYLGDGCVAVGPGWALFADSAQADAFAASLGTQAAAPAAFAPEEPVEA